MSYRIMNPLPSICISLVHSNFIRVCPSDIWMVESGAVGYNKWLIMFAKWKWFNVNLVGWWDFWVKFNWIIDSALHWTKLAQPDPATSPVQTNKVRVCRTQLTLLVVHPVTVIYRFIWWRSSSGPIITVTMITSPDSINREMTERKVLRNNWR